MRQAVANLKLLDNFQQRVQELSLTDAAIARMLGVSKQYYSQVKKGERQPSAAFIAAAVASGLVDSLDQVARVQVGE